MRFMVVLNGSDDPTVMHQPITVEEEYALSVDPAHGQTELLLCIVRPEPWAVQAVEHRLRLRNVPYLRDDDHEGVLSLPDEHGNQVRLRWVADSEDPDAEARIQAVIATVARDGCPQESATCHARTLWRAMEGVMTIAYRLGQ